MKVNRTTLEGFFKRGKYPTESHFAAIFDSFVHQDDSIQTSQVEGLEDALANLPDSAAITALQESQTTVLNQLAQFTTTIASLQTLVENSDAMSVAEQAQQAVSTANATSNRMDHLQQNLATFMTIIQALLESFNTRITALENPNNGQEYSSSLGDNENSNDNSGDTGDNTASADA